MSEASRIYRRPAAMIGYWRLASESLARPAILLPAALLLLILSVTNIIALLNPPLPGPALPWPFMVATLVRTTALLFLAAVILRTAAGSARNSWMPDGAFWLFTALFTASLAVPSLLQIALGDMGSARTSLIGGVAGVLLVSPCAPWIVAAAVERPLAWRPADWLRHFERWLPQRIIWSLLLLVPLGALHSQLVQPQAIRDEPWAVAIGGAIVHFLILMIRLGLDVAAYRRVAQG